jgi:hypothetical protein
MALAVKVALKQDDDAEYGLIWKAEVKDWSLNAQGDSLEEVLSIMERKIITYLQETFGSKRKISASAGLASARVEFEINVAKDRTLREFEFSPSKDDDTKVTVKFGDHPPMDVSQEHLDLANKTLELSKQTGIPPETIIAAAKTKMKKEKEAGK